MVLGTVESTAHGLARLRAPASHDVLSVAAAGEMPGTVHHAGQCEPLPAGLGSDMGEGVGQAITIA